MIPLMRDAGRARRGLKLRPSTPLAIRWVPEMTSFVSGERGSCRAAFAGAVPSTTRRLRRSVALPVGPYGRRGLRRGNGVACYSAGWGTAGGLPGGCMPDDRMPDGCIPDNWMHDSRLSVAATGSDDPRPCRGLQDLNTQNHGPHDQSPRSHGAQYRDAQNRSLCTCGPSAGSAQSAESDRWPWKAPWDRSSGSKGDNLPRPPQRKATIGNSRRQVLGAKIAAGGGVLPGRVMAVAMHLLSEAIYGKRVMVNTPSTASPTTHEHPPMEQPARGRNLSETTTKNDNMQNHLTQRLFSQATSAPLIVLPKECRSEGLTTGIPFRRKAKLLRTKTLSTTCSVRRLVTVTSN